MADWYPFDATPKVEPGGPPSREPARLGWKLIGLIERVLCLVGRHDRMPLRRPMTRAERRRPHRRSRNIGIGRYGEVCARCGKVVAGQADAPRLGTL